MFANATHTASPQIVDHLGHFAARLGAGLRGGLEANRVYRELSALSGSQLAARGLVREDLGRMTSQALNNATR